MYDYIFEETIRKEISRWRSRKYRVDTASSATGPSYVETEVVYDKPTETLDDELFRMD